MVSVCLCCVGCRIEDDGGVAGVESGVVYRVMCEGGGGERVGASCDSVLVLIDLRNLLL